MSAFGGLGGECRSGAKIVQGERRTKTKLEGFVFLLPFSVYSDKIITFAIRMDGTVAVVLLHCGLKQSIRYYFAFSQEPRKLYWNKKHENNM